MSSASALRQPLVREPLVPVLADRVGALDVIGLRSRVTLQIVTESAATVPLPFVVDSGASFSLISLELAQLRRVPVPPVEAEIEIEMRTASGTATVRVRPGRVRAWLGDELRGYPFDWSVMFRVDAPVSVPSILGLGGIVRTCRWAFDGTHSLDAPYGTVTLEDIR